jgi:hypothetical protein
MTRVATPLAAHCIGGEWRRGTTLSDAEIESGNV